MIEINRHHMIHPESPEGLRKRSVEALKKHFLPTQTQVMEVRRGLQS